MCRHKKYRAAKRRDRIAALSAWINRGRKTRA